MLEYKLDPPDQDVDGVFRCADCEELISGGEWCYIVDGKYYCESCMKEHMSVAPYREEWY